MTEKQYRLNKWGTKLLKNNRPLFDWANESDDIVDLLNEQEERIKELEEGYEIIDACENCEKEYQKKIKELEKEVLDLRAEVGRLNNKKEVEIPHWWKYESSKGYTKKVNQDIRFDGDVE